MKITYKTSDLKTKEINLEDVVLLRINGIQIKEDGDGLIIQVDDRIEVNPNASNSISVRQKTRS